MVDDRFVPDRSGAFDQRQVAILHRDGAHLGRLVHDRGLEAATIEKVAGEVLPAKVFPVKILIPMFGRFFSHSISQSEPERAIHLYFQYGS